MIDQRFFEKGRTHMAEKLTPRKLQAMEMRSRIQSTALDLFDREGFTNVSVEEIAQQVGCSVGNIYHYFKSKDELALQVTGNVDRAYLALEQAYLHDKSTPAMAKLLDFVGRSLRISAEDEMLYKAFIHAMKYPEQAVLRRSETRVYYRLLQELVELCQAEGSIDSQRDSGELVEWLVTLHRGMLLEWRIYQGNFLLEERGRTIAAALLRGLR